MGLQDLVGKRSGRPRGSKTTPAWIRAARWAFDNLDNPDSVAPSRLAERLLALGRKHPDRLIVCLARLDALRQKADLRSSRGSPRVPRDEEKEKATSAA